MGQDEIYEIALGLVQLYAIAIEDYFVFMGKTRLVGLLNIIGITYMSIRMLSWYILLIY
jgi:hypothetical protein